MRSPGEGEGRGGCAEGAPGGPLVPGGADIVVEAGDRATDVEV